MMNAGDALSREHWILLEPLLDAVLELEPEQQALYLEETKRRDPAVWAELASLLRACESGGGFLSEPAAVTFTPLLADLLPAVPMELGPYKLIREIGRGGMATVYLADDPKHSRQVAVKVLHGEVPCRIGHKRFMREIEIAAGLSHPHILPLHDSGDVIDENTDPGVEGRILFFVSPYVAGETLRDLLHRDGAMSAADAARIAGEIAMALEYAHRQGVVHLDIKPANILLQEGHAIIADFGIARAMSSATEESAIRVPRMGTPAYMSPEQAANAHDIDGRSDIFSLGCLLYELAMGERPVRQSANVSGRTAFDVAALRARTSPEFAQVVARATAVARGDRFASASDFAVALRESTHSTGMPTRRRRRAIYLAGAVLLTVGGVLAAYRSRARADPTIRIIPDEKSIAVLPFVNASADKEPDYFADGLTEDVITLLAKSRDMRVSAATSAFKFRDRQDDAKDIARQLHVAFLLRGSVQHADSNIRVTAALIRAADGRTVWSATFDRKLDDVFAVQAEIATNAVKALKTTLLANALTGNARPRSSASYNLVLRGRYLLAESTQENAAGAVRTFQQALLQEPRNASAYAGLARAYRQQAGQGWIPVAEGYAKSREAARRAIAVDPQLADGYEALAWVQSTYDWNWDAAQASYGRALELEPGNAESLRSAALLMTRLGRYDDAIIGLRKAIERDPLAGTYSNLSYALGAAGRWDEAEGAARTALVLGPNAILRHFNLARALLFQGKKEEALGEVQLEKKESWRLMGLALVYHALGRHSESDRALAEYAEKNASHSAMQIAEVHAYRGHANVAFAWLNRAYAQHDPGIADLKDDPWLEGIRDDPRYAALLSRMNLR
jgi:serine/threonine protein kinase/Tfp pilus assembly protein PilF